MCLLRLTCERWAKAIDSMIYLCSVDEQPNLVRLRVIPAASNGNIAWLFLGSDARQAWQWQSKLGLCFTRIEIARFLHESATEMRAPFMDWLDKLNWRYGSCPIWWLTQLSERNTMSSPLFLYVCYLKVVQRCLASQPQPVLIVVQSWGLLETIRRELHVLGETVCVISPLRRYFEWCIAELRVVAAAILFWMNVAISWISARCTRKVAFSPHQITRPDRIVLLSTFFHESNLTPNGMFKDRYFPYLHEWLAEEGWDVWVLATIADRYSSLVTKYGWMRRSSTHFIIPEDWLTFSDYIGAWLNGFQIGNYSTKIETFVGVEMTSLVAEECQRQMGVNAPRQADLFRRLPARLRQKGFEPVQIVGWSENQMKDKALVLGCHHAFPHVPQTGVNNTTLLPNLLNLFPTAIECESGVVADRYVCSGPLPARLLSEHSNGKLNTIVGCGLRYDYLHKLSAGRSGIDHIDRDLIVLVALPVLLSIAVELLDCLTSIFIERDRTQWCVKPHPDYHIDDLRPFLPDGIWQRLRLVDGSLAEWISYVDVVISAGSGVPLEAVSAGLPSIQIASATRLNYNPLAWFEDESISLCFTANELQRDLDRISTLTTEDCERLASHAHKIRADWFSPVTPNGLRKFLL